MDENIINIEGWKNQKKMDEEVNVFFSDPFTYLNEMELIAKEVLGKEEKR